MRRLFVALFATAVLASKFSVHPEDTLTTTDHRGDSVLPHLKKKLLRDEEDYRISVKTGPLEDIARDFERFGITYWEETEDEREKLLDALQQAYTNTAAKVIMNFGKVFNPVMEEWAEIMQDVQVNPQCD